MIAKTTPYLDSHSIAFAAKFDRSEPRLRPRGTPATSYREQHGQQLQTNDLAGPDR